MSALLIRPCSLLSALIGLFEMCWRAALPFDVRDRPTGSTYNRTNAACSACWPPAWATTRPRGLSESVGGLCFDISKA